MIEPTDPHPTTIHCEDACVAIGIAVLDQFAKDAATVTVTPDGEGGWWCSEYPDAPSP